jgi:NADP-dependent 3-hydroxy acid dehydrogenase YdfG
VYQITKNMKLNEELLKGKVVAITGASSGIGESIAKLLATHGAKVVLGARREDRLVALSKYIKDGGGDAAYLVTDVKKRTDLISLVNLACERYGRLDVMINNAGIAQLSLMADLDVEGWEDMIDVNLKGTLYGIAASMPEFKKQNSGHIINIISTSGINIVPMQAVYAGTKNAVRTISEALRQESDGWLRITGISPGFVQTELANGIKNQDMQTAIRERMELLAISPDNVAQAVHYAITQPANVDIGDIVIRPAAQN